MRRGLTRVVKEERLEEPDYYQLVLTSTIEPLLFISTSSTLPRIRRDNTAFAKFIAVRIPAVFPSHTRARTVHKSMEGGTHVDLSHSCCSIPTLRKRWSSAPRNLTSR
jgi:hypothetical protein